MQLHAGKSCRDGDQLADSGNQATDKSGECSVLVEIFFGMLHFGFIDQAHVSETAVGELVDDGTSQPAGQIVIDNSTEVGSQGGEEHYQIDVQLFVDCRFVGCRRNDYFGWKGMKELSMVINKVMVQ